MLPHKSSNTVVTKSDYLLTNLYRTRYFSHINQPLIIAYLIPFKDGNNQPYEDSSEGVNRKRIDIEQNRLGVARNYASQGFTFGLLYKPQITFSYYYEQLKKLNIYIKHIRSENQNMGKTGEGMIDIESDCLRDELADILSKPTLYFKKNHDILQEDKKVLRGHLSLYGNRFVLAELLYYITSKNHQLPIISDPNFAVVQRDTSVQQTSTIVVWRRSRLDESSEEMRQKLSQVRTFQLLCFNGSTFLDANGATGVNSFFSILSERLLESPPMRVEIILSEPGSAANEEAAAYKVAPYHAYIAKNRLSRNSIAGIEKLREQGAASVYAKTTRLHLPYSINIFRFFESKQDYLKVDLYSPYISSNGRRPSFVVSRMVDPDLFEHFETVFSRVWNDEENSKFI